MVMNPEDPARLYSWLRPVGLFVTSDSGNTWTPLPADQILKLNGFRDTYSEYLLINPKNPKLLYLLGSSLLEVEIHPN